MGFNYSDESLDISINKCSINVKLPYLWCVAVLSLQKCDLEWFWGILSSPVTCVSTHSNHRCPKLTRRIVVYPNWPLFHGSLIKNWRKIGPIVLCMNNEVDHSARHWDRSPERQPLPTQTAHIPLSHNPFPKLNPKPNIAQKANIAFLAVLRGRLWGSLALPLKGWTKS